MNFVEPGSTSPVILNGGVGTAFTPGGVGTYGVRVEDDSNTIVIARTTTLTEIGVGIYKAMITWPTEAGDYIPIWDNGAGVELADEITRVGYDALAVTSSLDLATVREHVETGLTDAALSRLMTDAVEEVEARFGTDDDVTEILSTASSTLVLKRAATAIVSVNLLDSSGTSYQTLGPTEYRLRNGRILERMSGGTTGYDWVRNYDAPGYGSTEVEVVYTPKPEAQLRQRVAIDLIRLAVQHEALATQKVGDYSMTAVEYTRERERILQGVSNRRGLRFA